MAPIADPLAHLTNLTHRILRDDEEAVREIVSLGMSADLPAPFAALYEQIGQIVIQRDVKTFHLEVMIEDLLKAQAQLSEAQRDPLTGLPNRALFHNILEQACARTLEEKGMLALFFIDLDRFKQVNDTLGHDAGDELLVQVSRRITDVLRQHDILARLGGDEFAAILPGLEDEIAATARAAAVVDALTAQFLLRAGHARIGCSIGISFFPTDVKTPIALVKNADVAMYVVKRGGRNGYRRYSDCFHAGSSTDGADPSSPTEDQPR